MNLASLTILDHVRGPATEARRGTESSDFADFMILEVCVTRCEALAEEGIECGLSRSLLAQLSECISACDSYLAAKARESSYEGRLREFCAEILDVTAALCMEEETETAAQCLTACRACLKLLGPRHDEAEPLWS